MYGTKCRIGSLPHTFALLLALALAPLATAASSHPGSGLAVDVPEPGRSAALPADVAAVPLLAIILPAAEPWESPWAEVAVEVRADGETVHQQSFLAQRRDEKVRVELLAHQPERRHELLARAHRDRGSVIAQVTIDGAVVHADDLTLLHAAPPRDGDPVFTDLRWAEVGREDGPSALFAAASSCPAKDACRADCGDDRQVCVLTFCPGQPIQQFCTPCEFDFGACLDACDVEVECPCVDPKSVTTSTETYLLSQTSLGWECMRPPGSTSFSDGYFYQGTTSNYRQDEVQVTEYCDGTTSTTILSSTYFSATCLSNTYLACSYPWQQAWYGCI